MTMAYTGFNTVNAVAVETLAKTVERVGWDKLNGQEIFKTLTGSKSFNALGFQPFAFAPGTRSPIKSRIVQIKKGDVIPLSGWLSCPDMRPAEYR